LRLTDSEFKAWHTALELSDEAVTVIEEIRSGDSVRKVGGGNKNVWGRYPSAKMGWTVQFESHTVELPAIYLMEHDTNVLEYYDQPSKIQLDYKSASGRAVGPVTTPDFFVLWRDRTGWEEWKTEADLRDLQSRSPNRWVLDESGWHCPPGQARAEPLGLVYRLRSEDEINPIVVRNLRWLEDYFIDDSELDQAVVAHLKSVTSGDPGIVIADLIHEVQARLNDGASQ
jgi:putative transposase